MTSTPIVQTYNSKPLQLAQRLRRAQQRHDLFHRSRLQAPSPAPQSQNRVYRLPPGATTPMVVDMARGRTQRHHAVARRDVPVRHRRAGPVPLSGQRRRQHRHGDAHRPERRVSAATAWASTAPGNLYVTSNNQVIVVNPTGTGTMLGKIMVSGVQSVTNVAFGGTNHQTLYITGLGTAWAASDDGSLPRRHAAARHAVLATTARSADTTPSAGPLPRW